MPSGVSIGNDPWVTVIILAAIGIFTLGAMLWHAWNDKSNEEKEAEVNVLRARELEEAHQRMQKVMRDVEANFQMKASFPDDWDEDAYIKEEKEAVRKAQVEKERPETNETENIDGKSFEQMTPDEFEDAVCKLFNAFGYNLSVTQRSKDGGIDLDGLGAGLGQARVVVQCKRYSSPVGVSAVRELFGVVSDDPEIAEGFLVTTNTFTQEAQAFARGKRITLVDGAELEMRFSKLANSGFR